MAFSLLLRRVNLLRPVTNSLLSSQCSKFFSSKSSPLPRYDRGHSVTDRLHLSPLFSGVCKDDDMKDFKIEVVDDATWRVSSGLADAWRENDEKEALQTSCGFTDHDYDGIDDCGVTKPVDLNKNEPAFDEIEDMRIHGKLFYKIDRDSREYEEYKFDFHGRKSSRNDKNRRANSRAEEKTRKKDSPTEIKNTNKGRPKGSSIGFDDEKALFDNLNERGDSCFGKKQRTLTFNQITAPYHEPFCLDIYISKASVRACVIHRATSKVVAVSHSISKDMKFDLGSTKNRSACTAVGRLLAQRALEDDIHNVVYTPRRGEKLEGKIGVVVKAIADGGVNVKVKLKQKKSGRGKGARPGIEDRRSFQ
ncbi:Ribosomal L18p/L5e family protein [Striga hermonthica]|uniref:Ribosomal L18p/L5e family protein n=1 Tax=Striga hermonthica TaxID=68872 RepID=A0A9N7NHT2_STRHE|nr:Ribosomal L18p/L5e family protein [Striga hermonthica]